MHTPPPEREILSQRYKLKPGKEIQSSFIPAWSQVSVIHTKPGRTVDARTHNSSNLGKSERAFSKMTVGNSESETVVLGKIWSKNGLENSLLTLARPHFV